MWKGRPVNYNKDDWPCYLHPDDNRTFVRIHFPEGPPELSSLRDTQEKDEDYTPEIAEQYKFFVENGFFKEGYIPAVPPRTEWVSFDF
jgi:nucleoporin NUP42